MKKFYAAIELLVIVTIISVGIGCGGKVGETSEYQRVTIKELVSDTTAYDGQKILVRGKYIEGPWPVPECEPTGTGENPEIREGYAFYNACSWGISDLDGFGLIGVVVIAESGAHNNTPPNYERHQEIELKGIARSTTVGDDCDRDIRYKSVYMEANERDVDITSKPPPKTKAEVR